MRRLLKILDNILIRFLAFSLAFLIGLPFISQTLQKQNSRLLNVEIYKRPFVGDCPSPNPLFLFVRLDDNNRLTLNGEEFNIQDTTALETRLSEVFKERKITSVGEIEKSVFIYPDSSSKFGDLEKITEALTRAGANPIFIDPFKLKCPDTYGCGYRTKIKRSAHNQKRKIKSNKTYSGTSNDYFDLKIQKKQ